MKPFQAEHFILKSCYMVTLTESSEAVLIINLLTSFLCCWIFTHTISSKALSQAVHLIFLAHLANSTIQLVGAGSFLRGCILAHSNCVSWGPRGFWKFAVEIVSAVSSHSPHSSTLLPPCLGTNLTTPTCISRQPAKYKPLKMIISY